MISMIDVSQIAIKKPSYLHSQILYKQIVIQSCFLPQLNYDGLIPSNTQGFPVLMKVSQRLSTSRPYAGDWSLYRRAFQNSLSSILHYLLHTQTLLSSMSRAKGKILLASFKNSHITLQSWLMGFLLFFWQRFLK